MATYILTMQIDANDAITTQQIQDEIYDACENVPFGFDITSVTEES